MPNLPNCVEGASVASTMIIQIPHPLSDTHALARLSRYARGNWILTMWQESFLIKHIKSVSCLGQQLARGKKHQSSYQGRRVAMARSKSKAE